METIRIKALDTLYFGSGRPFTMGEESWATAKFPPSPSTVYGMLRSVFFKHNLDKFKMDFKGENDPSLELRITFLGLETESRNERNLIFPLPEDYVLCDKAGSIEPKVMVDIDEKIISCYPESLSKKLTSEQSKPLSTKGIYIVENQFQEYLKGNTIDRSINLKEYTIDEVKIGINRKKSTRITENLYRIPLLRMQNKDINGNLLSINMLVSYQGIEMVEKNINRFGGEGKVVQLTKTNFSNNFFKPSGTTAKMFLATPAIFNEGSLPTALFSTFKIKILTASIPNAVSIGGWDIALKRPKPMLKAVPAGSVYSLEEEETGKLDEFVNRFHGKCLSVGVPDGIDKEGYGLVYFAKINT